MIDPQKVMSSEPYIDKHFEDIGEGILESYLDINGINTISRIPNSVYQSITNLKMRLACNIMKISPFRYLKFY